VTLRRVGGIFRAGAALTAGMLLGLLAGDVRLPPPLFSLVLAPAALVGAAFLLLPAAGPRSLRVTSSARAGPAAMLAVCVACGVSLGLRSGDRVRASCTGGLSRGAPVRATGLLVGVEDPADELEGDRSGDASVVLFAPIVRWTPGGEPCEDCGKPVERRWAQEVGDDSESDERAFVCRDCKQW